MPVRDSTYCLQTEPRVRIAGTYQMRAQGVCTSGLDDRADQRCRELFLGTDGIRRFNAQKCLRALVQCPRGALQQGQPVELARSSRRLECSHSAACLVAVLPYAIAAPPKHRRQQRQSRAHRIDDASRNHPDGARRCSGADVHAAILHAQSCSCWTNRRSPRRGETAMNGSPGRYRRLHSGEGEPITICGTTAEPMTSATPDTSLAGALVVGAGGAGGVRVGPAARRRVATWWHPDHEILCLFACAGTRPWG